MILWICKEMERNNFFVYLRRKNERFSVCFINLIKVKGSVIKINFIRLVWLDKNLNFVIKFYFNYFNNLDLVD